MSEPLEVSIAGVPCVDGVAKFTLAPVAVLYGPNGSCKSTTARYVYMAFKTYGRQDALPYGRSKELRQVYINAKIEGASLRPSNIMSVYIPSHRVAYIKAVRAVVNSPVLNALPAEMSMFVSTMLNLLQSSIVNYIRIFLGPEVDAMLSDLSALGIDPNDFQFENDSTLNMELLFYVLSRIPQNSVVVVDDLDLYLDDNYADALSELTSAVKRANAYLFATVRRNDVFTELGKLGARLYLLEPVSGKWSVTDYASNAN